MDFSILLKRLGGVKAYAGVADVETPAFVDGGVVVQVIKDAAGDCPAR